MPLLRLILLVLSLVLFLIAAANIPAPRINLIALGLAAFVAAFLVGS